MYRPRIMYRGDSVRDEHECVIGGVHVRTTEDGYLEADYGEWKRFATVDDDIDVSEVTRLLITRRAALCAHHRED